MSACNPTLQRLDHKPDMLCPYEILHGKSGSISYGHSTSGFWSSRCSVWMQADIQLHAYSHMRLYSQAGRGNWRSEKSRKVSVEAYRPPSRTSLIRRSTFPLRFCPPSGDNSSRVMPNASSREERRRR